MFPHTSPASALSAPEGFASASEPSTPLCVDEGCTGTRVSGVASGTTEEEGPEVKAERRNTLAKASAFSCIYHIGTTIQKHVSHHNKDNKVKATYLFLQAITFVAHKGIAFSLEERFNEVFGNIHGQRRQVARLDGILRRTLKIVVTL